MDKWLELALEAAREAGVAIMRYYPQTLAVQNEHDGPLLTLADHAAHLVIADCLLGGGLVRLCSTASLDAGTLGCWLCELHTAQKNSN